MKKNRYILIIVFAIITLSCTREKSQIDKVFSDINSKYSSVIELPEDKKLSTIFTKQVTYKTEEYNLEIQIWKANSEIYEPDYILFLKRNDSQITGIPIFSNNYSEYWNFNNESNHSLKDNKKTFEYEYNSMLEKLHLDSNHQSSVVPISFLNYYFDSNYFDCNNNNEILDPDTFLYLDESISMQEMERKKMITKNLQQINQFLCKETTEGYQYAHGIFDRENNRIMLSVFKYDYDLKRGKYGFVFFRHIRCHDPAPCIEL